MREYVHNYTYAEIDASCDRAADLTSNPKQDCQEWIRGRVVYIYRLLTDLTPLNCLVSVSRDAMGYVYPNSVKAMLKNEFKRVSFIYIPDHGFALCKFTPSRSIPKNVKFVLNRNMKGNQIIIENSEAKHTINILE